MALRFYARYKQFNKNVQGTIGDPIRYDLAQGVIVPQNTTIVQNTGVISHPTGFDAYPNWYEFTGDIIDGIGVKIKVGGSDKTGESKRLLYTDSDIEVDGAMARFVFFHLVNNANSRYNAIQVRIDDDSCGEVFSYPIFLITADNVDFEVCDTDAVCTVRFNITQDSDLKSCLESTLIDVSPNAKGNSYFDNLVGQIHPRFHVGYDRKARGLYVLFSVLGILILPLNPFLGLIYKSIFGLGFRKISPFVRTYLNNVCEHCNLQLDSTVFIQSTNVIGSQTIDEPKRGLGSIFGAPNSPYYNTCLMYDSTNADIEDSDQTTTYIKGITPITTGANFLNELVKPTNAKWEIYGNTLFLHRTDSVLIDTPILDFANNSTHLEWLTDCIQISTIEAKKSPKMLEITFGEDMEQEGAKMKSSYQRVANFGFTNYSSVFGGSQKIDASQFGMIQTTKDKTLGWVSQGYIAHGIFDHAGTFIQGLIWYNLSNDIQRPTGGEYTIIALSTQAWNAWKMVDYDPKSDIMNAEVKEIDVQPYVPYNPSLRVYDIIGILGGSFDDNRPTYQKHNAIWHFDSEYTDNLFYYFWYIEDTIRFPKRNEKANIKLKLCCQTIRKLGLNSPNKASIGFLVTIPINGKDILFTIEDLEIDYERMVITINAPVYRFNDSNRF